MRGRLPKITAGQVAGLTRSAGERRWMPAAPRPKWTRGKPESHRGNPVLIANDTRLQMKLFLI